MSGGDAQYDDRFLPLLARMEGSHFWYRGRYRFLMRALRDTAIGSNGRPLAAVDIGGGAGGWLAYLSRHAPGLFTELAFADSSARGLELARSVEGVTSLHRIDATRLAWRDRWDVIFLLDVLEHIPDDRSVLQGAYAALRPGGLLFVTTPALGAFWSHNDRLAGHVRRYSRRDLETLAAGAGFSVERTRYFMFFLSPLLWIARRRRVDVDAMSGPERMRLMERAHRVPPAAANRALGWIFAAETPLGWHLPFPWGTSVLAVLRKPSTASYT